MNKIIKDPLTKIAIEEGYKCAEDKLIATANLSHLSQQICAKIYHVATVVIVNRHKGALIPLEVETWDEQLKQIEATLRDYKQTIRNRQMAEWLGKLKHELYLFETGGLPAGKTLHDAFWKIPKELKYNSEFDLASMRERMERCGIPRATVKDYLSPFHYGQPARSLADCIKGNIDLDYKPSIGQEELLKQIYKDTTEEERAHFAPIDTAILEELRNYKPPIMSATCHYQKPVTNAYIQGKNAAEIGLKYHFQFQTYIDMLKNMDKGLYIFEHDPKKNLIDEMMVGVSLTKITQRQLDSLPKEGDILRVWIADNPDLYWIMMYDGESERVDENYKNSEVSLYKVMVNMLGEIYSPSINKSDCMDSIYLSNKIFCKANEQEKLLLKKSIEENSNLIVDLKSGTVSESLVVPENIKIFTYMHNTDSSRGDNLFLSINEGGQLLSFYGHHFQVNADWKNAYIQQVTCIAEETAFSDLQVGDTVMVYGVQDQNNRPLTACMKDLTRYGKVLNDNTIVFGSDNQKSNIYLARYEGEAQNQNKFYKIIKK